MEATLNNIYLLFNATEIGRLKILKEVQGGDDVAFVDITNEFPCIYDSVNRDFNLKS